MNNLRVLKNYFSVGDAQGESEILHDTFVTPTDYEDIIEPSDHKIKILVGRKGSGKSAILSHVEDECQSRGCWSIYLTPPDFSEDDVPEGKTPATIISEIYRAILKGIALKIGGAAGAFKIGSDGDLREFSKQEGERNLSSFDYVKRTFQAMLEKQTGFDIEKITKPLPSTSRRVERAVQESLTHGDKRVVYVLIDDSDQIADAGAPDYFDMIWYEILAVWKLAKQLDHVYPVISIRKEIWDNFTRDSGNRDKFDQVRMMTFELNPDRQTMIQILEKRLRVCSEEIDGSFRDVYEPFFDDVDCKMPSSDERRLWKDYIVSSSRTPRDIVQLVAELTRNAIRRQSEKISERDVDEVTHIFSDERMRDLIEQNKKRYKYLESLIQSFIYMKFRMSADMLKKHLDQDRFRTSLIDGTSIRPQDDIVFPLWKLLNNIGFITARIRDERESKAYRFLPYQDRLFSPANWTELQKYEWEIHPCYRTYLKDYRDQERNRDREKFERKQAKEDRRLQ